MPNRISYDLERGVNYWKNELHRNIEKARTRLRHNPELARTFIEMVHDAQDNPMSSPNWHVGHEYCDAIRLQMGISDDPAAILNVTAEEAIEAVSKRKNFNDAAMDRLTTRNAERLAPGMFYGTLYIPGR